LGQQPDDESAALAAAGGRRREEASTSRSSGCIADWGMGMDRIRWRGGTAAAPEGVDRFWSNAREDLRTRRRNGTSQRGGRMTDMMMKGRKPLTGRGQRLQAFDYYCTVLFFSFFCLNLFLFQADFRAAEAPTPDPYSKAAAAKLKRVPTTAVGKHESAGEHGGLAVWVAMFWWSGLLVRV
jgi:hypothetical protein